MKLTNKKILVTRDARQAGKFAETIERYGGSTIFFPTISIAKPHSSADLDETLDRLSVYDWIIFTSVNSVSFFIKRLHDKGLKLPRVRMAAIGSKTNNVIQEYGYNAHVLPDSFTAASLLERLKEEKLKDKRVLLPVSDIARKEIYYGLIKLGARVDKVIVYQNRQHVPENKNAVIALIHNAEIDVLTFFSPSAVRNFVEIIGAETLKTIRRQKIPVAVIGPSTANAALEAGLMPQIKPVNSTSENVLEAIVAYYQTTKE